MNEALGKIKELIDKFNTFERNFKKCSTANKTKGYLEGRLTAILEWWEKMQEANSIANGWYDGVTNTHEYFEKMMFDDIEEKYFVLLGTIKENIDGRKVARNQTNNGNTERSSQIKLPKITLPTFSGDYDEWLSFRNRFVTMINDNQSISNIEKMEYLKSCLLGDAAKTIQRFQITDSNYILAWERLNEQYNNTRVLQFKHIESILEKQEVKTASAKSLKYLVESIQDSLESLKHLNIDVSQWGPWLLVLLTRKLPISTRTLWEQKLQPVEVPTFDQLCEFIRQQYRALECLEKVGEDTSDHTVESSDRSRTKPSRYEKSTLRESFKKCIACDDTAHSIMNCDKFIQMSVAQRNAFVTAKSLCRNCLGRNHMLANCKSQRGCLKCGKRHNTQLHRDSPVFTSASRNSNTYVKNNSSQSETRSNFLSKTTGTSTQMMHPNKNAQQTSNRVAQTETLFPTALIKVESVSGIVYTLRALIDQCSDSTFIKSNVAKMLGLQSNRTQPFEVVGLQNSVTSRVNSVVNLSLLLRDTETMVVRAYVIEKLVGILPKTEVKGSEQSFKNIVLADPKYATPNNIDVMLGGEVYSEILLQGILKEDGYLAQNTKLGWIVSGRGKQTVESNNESMCFHSKISEVREEERVEEIMRKFWEIEELPRKQQLSEEELRCEEHFREHYKQDKEGRIVVKLPFKTEPSEILGESRKLAVARWLAVEKKLEQNEQLKNDYMEALREYLTLDHMSKVEERDTERAVINKVGETTYSCYYIPHHAVIRESSTTTKTRIVFDASAKTRSNVSLNEILMVGPTIQDSLFLKILKWRQFKYVLRGDITKMYRQVKVYEDDSEYQRIVCRFRKEDPISDYKLNTLTFGTASAPFLAIRALKQVALDGSKEYPVGSKVVESDFHVDDLLTGGDSVEQTKTIYRQVTDLLQKAGFPMRKWVSNNQKVLEVIPEEHKEIKALNLSLVESIKTLGITWNPSTDHFMFKSPTFDIKIPATKRLFLSEIAKLFDPLGWLAPVVIKPKMWLQELWKAKIDWDEQLPQSIEKEWDRFRANLKQIENIKIPRWFGFKQGKYKVELHGFCDSSMKAYGAVVYVKTVDQLGKVSINIVTAKTKVAPLQTVQLPRLELCGGVILARLIRIVSDQLNIAKVYCWSDSAIVLSWINSNPYKHKTFISNRIAEIQSLTQKQNWRHVASADNPADCLSRGVGPSELVDHNLWWKGPKWLQHSEDRWPKGFERKIVEQDLEIKKVHALVTNSNTFISDLMHRYSSFVTLIRVTSRIRRLIVKPKPSTLLLSVREMEDSETFWVKVAQEEYASEIKDLKNRKPLHNKSKLLSLNPFVDSEGVLRVGGRLKESEIDYEAKHQIIMPKESVITQLIISDAHHKTKHGGTQSTMTHTRMRFWILDARNTIKFRLNKCVVCHRHRGQVQEQLMGNLPKARVNMSRAFLHTGVDYAGPLEVLTVRKPGRRQTTKGYIALFVCLCTKAIHLELVSSLSTEAFLAAFTRFSGRRGMPSNIYSDNGTTFIGAKNVLDKDFELIKREIEPQLADIMLKDKVEWSFIPPSAPHQGGLWEAGVKAMKYHLRRMTKDAFFTFEELTTMLVEIEACLNSRPLCPVSSDPTDFSVLTPAHFLIGDNLLAPPRPSLYDVNTNRLGLYKQISQRVEHFSRRWKREYLNRLQHRSKWMKKHENIQVGNLVIIKEDNLPPAKWLLGRVVGISEGKDNLVRKVEIRTATTTLIRPITKVSILPVEETLPSPNQLD